MSHRMTNQNDVVNDHSFTMKIISLLHVTLAQAFYRWAMSEIDPMHPDVPRIMLRQKELSDRAQRLFV